MICSKVSIFLTLITGVEDLVVERRGKGRFNPQSPFASDDWGVVMDIWVGCGSVEVSELNPPVDDISPAGRGSGGGIEKTLDARRRAPPGDTLRDAIVTCSR